MANASAEETTAAQLHAEPVTPDNVPLSEGEPDSQYDSTAIYDELITPEDGPLSDGESDTEDAHSDTLPIDEVTAGRKKKPTHLFTEQELEPCHPQVDLEDDQLGPETDFSLRNIRDSKFTKNRAILSVNDSVITAGFHYPDPPVMGISSSLTFHFPDELRGSIIVSCRVPRLLNQTDNPANIDSWTFEMEIPSQSVNNLVTVADVQEEDIPEQFRPYIDIFKVQQRDSTTLMLVTFSCHSCLFSAGTLPLLRNAGLDRLMSNLVTDVLNHPSFILLVETFGTSISDKYQLHLAAETSRDPMTTWFRETPNAQRLNVGNLLPPMDRPEIPVQRPRHCFLR